MERQAPPPVKTATHSAAASAAASFFLFVAAWLAMFLASGAFLPHQWAALIAVSFATWVCTTIIDRRWPIGFFVRPALAIRELILGIAFAVLLIGTCDLVLMLVAHAHHTRNDGLPWHELAAVFLPAAFHEELAFRGYLFQKLRSVNRILGFAFSAFVFAALHLGNQSVTPIALANIAIAGILLALAYERYERLWFPIGIHLAWNLLSGPILGYPVSGFVSSGTLFTTTVRGPVWLTGGAFGIEGSVMIAIVELAGIALLATGHTRSRRHKT